MGSKSPSAAPPPASPAQGPAAGESTAGPPSLRVLFLAFNGLALAGFGGVMPVAQHVLVEKRRWLTQREFVELLTVCQVLPGPNIGNMALLLGDRWFGWRGALVAFAGMFAAPLALVIAITALYAQFAEKPAVVAALAGMGAVSAGLLLATAWRMAGTQRGWPPAWGLGMAAFLAVGVLRWPLVPVLLVLGPVGVALAWRRLAAADAAGPDERGGRQ